MKDLVLIFLFFFSFNVNAQDETYEYLTRKQKKVSLKIAKEKTGSTLIFDSGINYSGMFFWSVITYDGKKLFFNSSTSFTNVKYSKGKYPSLIEYVVKVAGF